MVHEHDIIDIQCNNERLLVTLFVVTAKEGLKSSQAYSKYSVKY